MASTRRKAYDPKDPEPFKLSRTKIDLFVDCPRCFYIDRRMLISRPQGFPFNINSTVDILLKKEFDIHRVNKTTHPYMIEAGIQAIPFLHPDLDTWRLNFTGGQTLHKETNFIIFGAIDDIWMYTDGPEKGKLIIVDYKATSKEGEVSLDAEWQSGYRRQLEVYQWIFRHMGFNVCETGYFVYANALRDKPSFDNKLEFSVTMLSHIGNTEWIDTTLINIKKCLDDNRIPKQSETCEYCKYRNEAGKSIKEHSDKYML